MPVQVYLDAFPDQVYEGIFSEIDTMPENGSDF
jgi:multidrug resistance efflux pump